jgi:hypothetical protein
MVSLENKPIYLWDFYFQFSDLLDFLEFSESNIEYKRKINVQNLNRTTKLKNIDHAEYAAELQNIEGRFDITLSRSIRYSAVIALATTIEWISKFLNSNAFEKAKESNGNKSINILKEFIIRSEFNKPHNVDKLDKIIKIRNCITHSMGSVKGDRFEVEIKDFINAIEGFSLSDSHFIEEVINIEKGTIESIITETQGWLIDLIEECRQKNQIEIK